MPISISWLKSLVLLALVGVGLLFQSFQSANGASSNTQNFTAADMSQLTNQYCLACHNDSLATAGLSLQGLDYADTTQHAETMEKMVKKLRAHTKRAYSARSRQHSKQHRT